MTYTRLIVAFVAVAGLLVAGTGAVGAEHTPEVGEGCEEGASVSELDIPPRAVQAAAPGVNTALHSVCGGALQDR